MPILLDRLSYMSRHGDQRLMFGDLTALEVLHRNFWFTTFSDERTISLRHEIGVDHIMYETDFPHTDSSWPHTQAIVAGQLAGVPASEADAMTYQNAAALYRHPLPPELGATS